MTPDHDHDEQFVGEVRRQADRAVRARQTGFWQGLAAVGTVGWMVTVPAVAGAMAGRWLDERFANGIFWTLSLLVGGLAIGCASAWRYVRGELKP
jgi:ATP synthase protein I